MIVVKTRKELTRLISNFSVEILEFGDVIKATGKLGSFEFSSESHFGGPGTAGGMASIRDRVADCFSEIVDGVMEALLDRGETITYNGEELKWEDVPPAQPPVALSVVKTQPNTEWEITPIRNRAPFKIEVTLLGVNSFHVLTTSIFGTPVDRPALRPYAHQAIEIIDQLPTTLTDGYRSQLIIDNINAHFEGTEYFQGVVIKDLRENV